MRLASVLKYNLLISSLLCAGTACAQQGVMAQSNNEAVGIGDIVVTAQKRSERLSDVPISVTAVSGGDLAARGINGPADLEKVALGFNFRPSIYGSPVFQIRGIGFFEESIAIAPTVSVYVNQAPLPYSAMAEGASLDVERVEVLKGPQGTLFGQNSTGGAINYIPARPTDKFEARLDAGIGNFSAVDLGGFISGSITDTLRARVAVRSEQRGDWQKSITSDRTLGQRDFLMGRVLLDWDAADTVRFELNLNGWRNRSDTQAKQFVDLSLQVPANAPLLDILPELQAYPRARKNARLADWDPDKSLRRDDSFWQATLRSEVDLTPGVSLTAITAYSHLKVDRPTDVDGTRLLSLFTTSIGKIESFSQEVRLDGALIDNRLRWMVGGNYQRDHTREIQDLQFDQTNLFVGPFNFRYADQGFRSKVEDWGVFGSLDFAITATLSAQASIRYTEHRIDYSGCTRSTVDGKFGDAIQFLSELLSGTPTDPIPVNGCVSLDEVTLKPLPIVNRKLSETNAPWRLGISWKPVSDAMIYANVTRGYKAGNFANVTSIAAAAISPVPQEVVTAYEVGLKASFLDRKAQLNAAAFYLDYKNKQLVGFRSDPVFGPLNSVVSIPTSKVKGVEVELTLRPFKGLMLRGGGTYVDSKVTGTFVTFDLLGQTIDRAGEAFPGTPKWALLGDAEYEFPAWSGWSAYVGGGVNYRSSSNAYFGNDQRFLIPGYTLVDLRAGFRSKDERYRVQFWGRNVTDKFYLTHASALGDTFSRSVGMPATYGITVSVGF